MRGYANIVPLSPSVNNNPSPLTSQTAETEPTIDHTDHDTYVYGLIYALQPEDEERLDMYEGVPEDYGKERLGVEVWEAGPLSGPGEVMNVLVYVDGLRTTEGVIRDEYVLRMRRAFREAAEKGLPREWMEGVFGRRFGVWGGRGCSWGELGGDVLMMDGKG